MTWRHVANSDQLSEGEVISVSIENKTFAIYHYLGEYYATENICTHQYALLSDGYFEDGCIECPLHQARFDIRTGQALCAPATKDLKTFPIMLKGGQILLKLE